MKVSNTVNLSTSRSNIATNNLTGIENISYNLFEVYPNPAKDMVQLILNYSSPSIVKIYNSTGQVIKTFETSSSFNINVSDIPNNLYIIEVCTGLKYEKQKLVINR